MTSVEHSEVQFGRTLIEYDIRRSSKRRTVAVTIFPAGNIILTAPTGATIPNDAIGGSRDNTRDITNVIVGEDVGGSYYSVVVMCDQPNGRASEVEFVFKFGI